MAIVYVDVPKVRGKMAERGYTITSMSDRLGINRNTLHTYLKRPDKMPYEVISSMADALCDSADEAAAIFLLRILRKTKECAAKGGTMKKYKNSASNIANVLSWFGYTLSVLRTAGYAVRRAGWPMKKIRVERTAHESSSIGRLKIRRERRR